jgi:hypothetical protein
VKTFSPHFLWCVIFSVANMALAVLPPADPPLPGYDRRAGTASGLGVVSPAQQLAVERLRLRQPQIQVEFDPITSGPKSITARGAFLSGSRGLGGAIPAEAASKFAVGDPYWATKAFLQEYRDLFGHGPEVLDEARVKQHFVTPHNGLRTVVWQQEVEGIPVFEAVLISHTSRRGELVNLSSRFLPGATNALIRAGQNRADMGVLPKVSARQALAIAAGQIGEQLLEAQIGVANIPNADRLVPDPEKRQKFRAPVLKGEAEARLVWLPMDQNATPSLLGRHPDGKEARGDVSRFGGCPGWRTAAATLFNGVHQRRYLPRLHERQPFAILARVFHADIGPTTFGFAKFADLQRTGHKCITQRLDRRRCQRDARQQRRCTHGFVWGRRARSATSAWFAVSSIRFPIGSGQ